MKKASLAQRHLASKDPVLKELVTRAKIKPHRREKAQNHFKALADAILSQQLSGKAAATIFKRFTELFPGTDFPSPRQVLKTRVSAMRKAGVSKQKAGYLKDLAAHIERGEIDFMNISAMGDEEVIEHLVRVKGIGRWTAEMFLMFSLGRPDVFSPGDLGLQNAIMKWYRLKKRPDPKKMAKISAAWSPYRTTACRYLWASLTLE
jgi:DNA-3-methyladenine glycosylase II